MSAAERHNHYCMRDFPLEPFWGEHKNASWSQFVGSLQLRLPLGGSEWEGIEENEFSVRVSETEMQVKCRTARSSTILEDLNGKFKRAVKARDCWFCLEADSGDRTGEYKALVVELAKKDEGTSWSDGPFSAQLFNRKSFAWGNMKKEEVEDNSWVTLKPGRRRDVDDPFVASRRSLCADLEQGQTAEVIQFRVLLHARSLEETLKRVSYNKLWGLDVTERRMKLFIRGDESTPVIAGELGGEVVPHESMLQMSEAPRNDGTGEVGPCLDVILLKARGSQREWKEPLKLADELAVAPLQFLSESEALIQDVQLLRPQIFHVRDFPLEPARGRHMGAHWFQFTASVQLWLPLQGLSWEGVQLKDFEVRVSDKGLSVKCARVLGGIVEDLSGRLKKEVQVKASWVALEKVLVGPQDQVCPALVVELPKKTPGRSWEEGVFELPGEPLFPDAWTGVSAGRPKDTEDPFVISRGWLCTELEQGQTDEFVQFRLVLDQKKLDESMQRVPYYKMWGLDVTEKFLKLFIRGDETSPVMLGRLGGRCVPERCYFELTRLTREVEGHRIVGTVETLPCLDVTIVKAADFMYEWEEMLTTNETDLNAPQGTLTEFEQKQLMGEPEPDREDWTPDDWADEQKEKADACFKDANYRDAVVYYTRALRYTPKNERLLSNRSAAHFKLNKFQLALDDAVKVEEFEPNWPKAYYRKGQALRGLKKFDDAILAFYEGKERDNENPEWDKEIRRTKEVQEARRQRERARK